MRIRSFVIGFFILFCIQSNSFSIDLYSTPGVTVSKQRVNNSERKETTIYTINSKLSKKQLIDKYFSLFSSQGWTIITAKDYKKDRFTFQKPPLESAFLVISSYVDGECEISLSKSITLPTLPIKTFKTVPHKIEFMPLYPGAKEYGLFSNPNGKKSVVYLVGGELEKVHEFYLKKAPSYQWTLVRTESHNGVYPLTKWLKIVDPFTHQEPALKARGLEKLVPPLKVRGKTFTFHNGNKQCVVTIYQFEDIVEKAVGTVFDVDSFAKFGRNMICVFYSPTKVDLTGKTPPETYDPKQMPKTQTPSKYKSGNYKIPADRYYRAK
ncbi:MAG: hypothetical protein PHV17_07010 [Candidatus Omnitrophica bacterium]|nr:hypothetical protein [Candidatus Omnitrophota bacterium]